MESITLEDMVNDDGFDISMSLLEMSSDEERQSLHGGSRPGKAPNIERGGHEAAQRLHDDYFATNPVYGPQHFEQRFRLSRTVFTQVVNALEFYDPCFSQRKDCTGQVGFTALQKATAAIRVLAYSSAADAVDEYITMGESTVLECVERFCAGVISCFGEEYLRFPTTANVRGILARSERRGFPGILGSIDCSKWYWKNCPTAYQGQFQGKEGKAALTLEVIADDNLWIWHLFFGMKGYANDINVLEASTLCDKIANGTYPPPVQFTLAGETRNKPYWLADGIYPRWPCFVQMVSRPSTRKEKLLAKCQEGARKDAERAFGFLQGKWHILGRPGRYCYTNTMHHITRCCVVLHNMMVEYRLKNDSKDDTEPFETGAIVGGDAYPMWVNSAEEGNNVPVPRTIAAQCPFSRFTNDATEYLRTRELVMDHLLMKNGSE